jgi:hypothetical protein
MIKHTLMSISSAQGVCSITTLRTRIWPKEQRSAPQDIPGSSLGESGLPSTTYKEMMLPPRLREVLAAKRTIQVSVRTTVMVGSFSVNSSSEVSLSGRALKRSSHLLHCLEAKWR